mmetsp:Transcript_4482/g.12967  ORF Transcript_4482/g.12967 Transcript_4482/m.12967 type:complete len:229 (+) Transcript_4482:809-1495(+)
MDNGLLYFGRCHHDPSGIEFADGHHRGEGDGGRGRIGARKGAQESSGTQGFKHSIVRALRRVGRRQVWLSYVCRDRRRLPKQRRIPEHLEVDGHRRARPQGLAGHFGHRRERRRRLPRVHRAVAHDEEPRVSDLACLHQVLHLGDPAEAQRIGARERWWTTAELSDEGLKPANISVGAADSFTSRLAEAHKCRAAAESCPGGFRRVAPEVGRLETRGVRLLGAAQRPH